MAITVKYAPVAKLLGAAGLEIGRGARAERDLDRARQDAQFAARIAEQRRRDELVAAQRAAAQRAGLAEAGMRTRGRLAETAMRADQAAQAAAAERAHDIATIQERGRVKQQNFTAQQKAEWDRSERALMWLRGPEARKQYRPAEIEQLEWMIRQQMLGIAKPLPERPDRDPPTIEELNQSGRARIPDGWAVVPKADQSLEIRPPDESKTVGYLRQKQEGDQQAAEAKAAAERQAARQEAFRQFYAQGKITAEGTKAAWASVDEAYKVFEQIEGKVPAPVAPQLPTADQGAAEPQIQLPNDPHELAGMVRETYIDLARRDRPADDDEVEAAKRLWMHLRQKRAQGQWDQWDAATAVQIREVIQSGQR